MFDLSQPGTPLSPIQEVEFRLPVDKSVSKELEVEPEASGSEEGDSKVGAASGSSSVGSYDDEEED